MHANSSRAWFVLGRAARNGNEETRWSLYPLPGQSSADVFTASRANCYVEVPPGDDMWQVGGTLTFEWLAGARGQFS